MLRVRQRDINRVHLRISQQFLIADIALMSARKPPRCLHQLCRVTRSQSRELCILRPRDRRDHCPPRDLRVSPERPNEFCQLQIPYFRTCPSLRPMQPARLPGPHSRFRAHRSRCVLSRSTRTAVSRQAARLNVLSTFTPRQLRPRVSSLETPSVPRLRQNPAQKNLPFVTVTRQIDPVPPPRRSPSPPRRRGQSLSPAFAPKPNHP